MSSNLLIEAVNNNAGWCAAVAHSHGIESEFHDDVWLCRHRMPPLYPNLITLQRVADLEYWLAQLPGSLDHGWGMKDSFAAFDLSDKRFNRLFAAVWYCCKHGARRRPEHISPVMEVSGISDFHLWVQAWQGTQELPSPVFVPEILSHKSVRLLMVPGPWGQAAVAGGMALYVSGEVVGISNLFGDHQSIQSCVAFIEQLYPRCTIVGYGDADELRMLSAIGFVHIGDLQVWLHG